MAEINARSEVFPWAEAVARFHAREEALAAGHAVVFMDDLGRYVQERPDGRQFEVRFVPGCTGESHLLVLGEVTPSTL